MSELETLYHIQELDTRLFELREREEKHPLKAELSRLEEEEGEKRLELEGAASSIAGSREKQGKLEGDVQRLEDKLQREEGKLYGGTVANPKELRGLQAEVRSLTRQKDKLETELLEEMERLDGVVAGEDELRSIHEEILSAVMAKKEELEGELAGIHAEVERLEKEKDELRSQVDGELLELYDKLLESKNHVAVVKVVDGVCQGCRVELAGKEYDRFLKSDSVFRCSNCRRILAR
ncbi:MAG: C4-type zinc ribbon domain-containing protein [Actinomycetota bacterium]|nr:C4-type zinc ribbon domain-containing protein [Actinomycetota bacterium]